MLTVYFHIILASTKYCSFAAKTQLPLTVFTYIYVCTVAFATFFVPSVLSVIVGYFKRSSRLVCEVSVPRGNDADLSMADASRNTSLLV